MARAPVGPILQCMPPKVQSINSKPVSSRSLTSNRTQGNAADSDTAQGSSLSKLAQDSALQKHRAPPTPYKKMDLTSLRGICASTRCRIESWGLKGDLQGNISGCPTRDPGSGWPGLQCRFQALQSQASRCPWPSRSLEIKSYKRRLRFRSLGFAVLATSQCNASLPHSAGCQSSSPVKVHAGAI